MIAVSLLAAAVGVAGEALLLRASFDVAGKLVSIGERAGGLAALAAVGVALLALEFSLGKKLLQLGRQLECRLRVHISARLPWLEDRYFRSRPVSDMADRCHNVHALRRAPELAGRWLRSVFELALTTAAVAGFFPEVAWHALAIALVAIGVPLAALPILAERDLRLRTHRGALTKSYLDALLGLTAIRCANGEGAVRREHFRLLEKWARTGLEWRRLVTIAEVAQHGGALLLVAWLIWTFARTHAEPGGLLLLVYWVLNLPLLGQEAAAALYQYPMLRNTVLRVLEPLGARAEANETKREDRPTSGATSAPACSASGNGSPGRAGLAAPRLRWENVTVRAGGHVILEDITLEIAAGSHVAIVGASGAGKSSLTGLLLGWHQPSTGRMLIDDAPFGSAMLAGWRAATAWIDPQVQIWNRSLFENLRFGSEDHDLAGLDRVLRAAGLFGVLEKLPRGLQTVLGENGGLVSGGEGQRVRFARGLARADVRLVILDEPARGLEHAARRELVRRARERWRTATLLCITHDISDTQDFDRVVVLDNARIVEEGRPAELRAVATSRYRRMLDAEELVRREVWHHPQWRRLVLENGRLVHPPRRTIAPRIVLSSGASETRHELVTEPNHHTS